MVLSNTDSTSREVADDSGAGGWKTERLRLIDERGGAREGRKEVGWVLEADTGRIGAGEIEYWSPGRTMRRHHRGEPVRRQLGRYA